MRNVEGMQKQQLKWVTKHENLYKKHNMCWPPPIPESWLDSVHARGREIVWFYKQKLQKSMCKRGGVIVLDANQSIDRIHKATDKVPCVCPSGILIMLNFKKGNLEEPQVVRISGIEALMLQFVPPSSIPNADKFTDRQLMDLAGNAFCGVAAYVAAASALSSSIFPTSVTRRGQSSMPRHKAKRTRSARNT